MMYDEVVGSVIKIVHRLDLTAKTSLEQEVIITVCACVFCYASRRSRTRDMVKLTVCVCVCVSVYASCNCSTVAMQQKLTASIGF